MAEGFAKLPLAIMERTDLTFAAKVMYAVLANRAREKGITWAGTRALAADIGGDRKTVVAAAKCLQEAGLIVVEDRGLGRSKLYRIVGTGGKTGPVTGGKTGPVTGGKTGPVTGGKTGPVGDSNRSKKRTPGGPKMGPQVVQKFPHKKKREIEEDPPIVPQGGRPLWTRNKSAPKAEPAQTVYRLACLAEAARGTPFSPSWGRDAKALKPHLHLGPEELDRRWRNFLEAASNDPFVAGNFSIAFFGNRIDAYAKPPPGSERIDFTSNERYANVVHGSKPFQFPDS